MSEPPSFFTVLRALGAALDPAGFMGLRPSSKVVQDLREKFDAYVGERVEDYFIGKERISEARVHVVQNRNMALVDHVEELQAAAKALLELLESRPIPVSDGEWNQQYAAAEVKVRELIAKKVEDA